jgi:hypothetical protein
MPPFLAKYSRAFMGEPPSQPIPEQSMNCCSEKLTSDPETLFVIAKALSRAAVVANAQDAAEQEKKHERFFSRRPPRISVVEGSPNSISPS